jgi:hypothetical protein
LQRSIAKFRELARERQIGMAARMLLFHQWRITPAEVRLGIALLGLLRLQYGILLFQHPAVCQREIGEKKHREKDPPSGKMEAQDEVRETVVAQNNK